MLDRPAGGDEGGATVVVVRLGLLLASLLVLTACGDTTGGSGGLFGATTSGTTTSGTTTSGTTTTGPTTGGSGPSDSPGGTGGNVPSEPPGDESVFPVVVTRVGGIAGFDDRVTVQASGSATVSTRRGRAPSCTLTDTAVARLASAAVAASTIGSPYPSAATSRHRVSDDLVTTLQSAVTHGAVRLPDSSSDDTSGALDIVSELLADLTGNPPAHRLCR